MQDSGSLDTLTEPSSKDRHCQLLGHRMNLHKGALCTQKYTTLGIQQPWEAGTQFCLKVNSQGPERLCRGEGACLCPTDSKILEPFIPFEVWPNTLRKVISRGVLSDHFPEKLENTAHDNWVRPEHRSEGSTS